MKVEIVDDYGAMSNRGAEIVAQQVRTKADSVLGLAAGNTPRGMYERLCECHAVAGLDFSRVTTFSLDEFLMPSAYQWVYRDLIRNDFLAHVNIYPENTNFPGWDGRPIPEVCADYEGKIRNSGGIDLQVLGVGKNAHLAFNEPGSAISSRTRKVTLAPETMQANAPLFGREDAVPRDAITMGIATILEANSILVLACGLDKAEPVHAMLEGPVTARAPASFLQRHPKVHVVADKGAASLLVRHS